MRSSPETLMFKDQNSSLCSHAGIQDDKSVCHCSSLDFPLANFLLLFILPPPLSFLNVFFNSEKAKIELLHIF